MPTKTGTGRGRRRSRPGLIATEVDAEVAGRNTVPSPGAHKLTAHYTSPESLRLDQAFPAQVAALAPHGRPAALAIAVVRDRAGFDALEPQWNALLAAAGRDTHLFQTFNWNWHWANHYLSAAAQPTATWRRLMRRLEEEGSIQITRHTGGGEARAAALAAIALKRAWSQSSLRLAPALSDARFAAFFADVAEARRRAAPSRPCAAMASSPALPSTSPH